MSNTTVADIASHGEPSQQRRLLDAAIAQIDVGGEAALRVTELSAEAGIRTASLYKWFGNRDGLVVAAQLARFERSLHVSGRNFARVVDTVTNPDEFDHLSNAIASQVFSPDRYKIGFERLNIIASAINRPELLSGIQTLSLEQQALAAKNFERAQSKGLITSTLDPMQLAGWVMSLSVGRGLLAFESDVVDRNYFEQLSMMAIRWMLNSERFEMEPGTLDYHPRTMPVSESLHPTAKVILDWATEEIENRGEANLRVSSLTEEHGLAVTAIYQHFGSREGLVRAVHTRRLTESYQGRLELLSDAVRSCKNRNEFIELIRSIIIGEFGTAMHSLRLNRIAAIGSSYGRPEVIASQARVRDDYYAAVEQIFDYAKVRNWVEADRDIATAMCWVDGIALGECLISLGMIEVDRELWVEMTADAISEFLTFPSR